MYSAAVGGVHRLTLVGLTGVFDSLDPLLGGFFEAVCTLFFIVGHVDIYTEPAKAEPDLLEDTKSGRKHPACMPQLGSYRMPLRQAGRKVERVAVRFLRRPARRALPRRAQRELESSRRGATRPLVQ